MTGRGGAEGGSRDHIAIVGMSCVFPGARDLASFWANIVYAVDAISEVPEGQWDSAHFFDPASKDFDRVYCRRGGFITDLAEFDPVRHGIMPNSVPGADPDQFIALKVAQDAICDAGYDTRPFDRDRAEVILGRTMAPGSGSENLILQGQYLDQIVDLIASVRPELGKSELRAIKENIRSNLFPCNADTIPGVMPNVMSGRIAQRLGLRGRNLILDAACASSLIAVETAVVDLQAHRCDLALAGGVHVNSNVAFYQMFCGLGALSRTQTIRPFDNAADGTILGEGAGMLVLKRLEDAVKDRDRIYAIIRGIGTTSDGHGTSVLAPSASGEALALRRAYEDAGVSPESVGLLEAHGTGTAAGDSAELKAIEEVFVRGNRTEPSADSRLVPWCALGSVKSMIGHTQAAGGVAGLIKAALSLYHRVLPPTLNVRQATSAVDWERFPCYLNTRTRPWIHPGLGASREHRRLAAVSAFGFGGVNAHAVLEEPPDREQALSPSLCRRWDAELCLFEGLSSSALLLRLNQVLEFLSANRDVDLKDVAYSLSADIGHAAAASTAGAHRAAIVASSVEDLVQKIEQLQTMIERHDRAEVGAHGMQAVDGTTGAGGLDNAEREVGLDVQVMPDIYFSGAGIRRQGKLAFVLPGLGAAYPNMLSELCLHFPEVREVFDYVDELALSTDGSLPSRIIFPSPGVAPAQTNALARMDSAVVTVLLAEWAMFVLLRKLGLKPDAVMGCSTGEFAALTMCGSVDILDAAGMFYRLSTNVARSIPEERIQNLRSINVCADWERIAETLADVKGRVHLASDLTPTQVLLSGDRAAIEEAAAALTRQGIRFYPLPYAIPYHTPLVEDVVDPDHGEFQALPVSSPSIPAWSCSTASRLPDNVDEVRRIATELFEHPIQFRRTVEAMYEDGVRIFVEVGPRGSLTPLADEVLAGKPHLVAASNVQNRSSVVQLNHLLALLVVAGVPANLEYLFQRRRPEKIDFAVRTSQATGSQTAIKLDLSYPKLRLSEECAELVRESVLPVVETQNLETPAASHQESDVMGSYFRTMSEFHRNLMGVQEQVMRAYMERGSDPGQEALGNEHFGLDSEFSQFHPSLETGKVTEAYNPSDFAVKAESPATQQRLPFLANAVVRRGQGEVEIVRMLTLSEDLYLLDHAIGGIVRTTSHTPEKVFLLPLMVALEIMVEAASLLMEGRVAVRLEEIRAYRRIRVDEEGFAIQVSAKVKRQAVNVVELEIRSPLSGAELAEKNGAAYPLMSCQVVFADGYPQSPMVKPLVLNGEREPRIGPDELYAGDFMFHGPRMQAVRALTRVGDRGCVGLVQIARAVDWFDGQDAVSGGGSSAVTCGQGDRTVSAVTELSPLATDAPRFLIDPLLLDNASQVVLFHLYEQRLPVKALLPFHVEKIELFDRFSAVQRSIHSPSGNQPGAIDVKAVVQARLLTVTERSTEAVVEIACPEGRLMARLSGISSRRIALPGLWNAFITNPVVEYLGSPLEIGPLAGDGGYRAAMRFALDDLPGDETVVDWLSDYLLCRSERETVAGLHDRRRREWLAGRIAAKDAVRMLVRERHDVKLCPADVEIVQSESGQPVVSGRWFLESGWVPGISIAHTEGLAVAVAIGPERRESPGIDVETVRQRDPDFEKLVLTEGERELLRHMPAADRDLAITHIWCAKEAVGKAVGRGLAGKPQCLEIQAIDRLTGIARVSITPVAEGLETAHGQVVEVHLRDDGLQVVAMTSVSL